MLGRWDCSTAFEDSSEGWELKIFSVRMGWNPRSPVDAIIAKWLDAKTQVSML